MTKNRELPLPDSKLPVKEPITPAAAVKVLYVPQPIAANAPLPAGQSREFGGQPGPEPTRFGDWENKGRCTDF